MPAGREAIVPDEPFAGISSALPLPAPAPVFDESAGSGVFPVGLVSVELPALTLPLVPPELMLPVMSAELRIWFVAASQHEPSCAADVPAPLPCDVCAAAPPTLATTKPAATAAANVNFIANLLDCEA